MDTVGGVVSIVNVIDVVAVFPALSIACTVTVCGLKDSVVGGVNDQEVVPLAMTYGLLSIFTCTFCNPEPESEAVP